MYISGWLLIPFISVSLLLGALLGWLTRYPVMPLTICASLFLWTFLVVLDVVSLAGLTDFEIEVFLTTALIVSLISLPILVGTLLARAAKNWSSK